MRKIQLLFVFCGLVLSIGCAPLPNSLASISVTTGRYTPEAINYLLTIGLGAELGLTTNNIAHRPVIKKWQSNIRIQIHGAYTPDDEQELSIIMSELSRLTGLSITRVHNGSANINIHFVPEDSFVRYISSYNTNSNQLGMFHFEFNPNYIIYRSTITIDNSYLQGNERRHILREELTQSLGLANDSPLYFDSIFQESPEYTPTQYSQIDKEVISLLYDPRIRPGMHGQDIYLALNNAIPQQGRSPVIVAGNP